MNEAITLDDINILDVGNTIQISGAIWSGNGCDYFCFFPSEFEKTSGNEFKILNMNLEEWKKFIRQTDIMETEVLAEDENGLKKIIVRKSARQIDQGVSWKVFKRDRYRCRYCGNDDVPLTVDHLILWEEGGLSIEENLVAACKKCNKKRGNDDYITWINSDYYNKVAENLTDEVRIANEELIDALYDIPKRIHKVSR